MRQRVREVIRAHARLRVDPERLSDDADLYDAGMSSSASVSVMLALEVAFDVEFPDRLLTRSVFSSVSSIVGALKELQPDAVA
jgi:acyl carrier protein